MRKVTVHVGPCREFILEGRPVKDHCTEEEVEAQAQAIAELFAATIPIRLLEKLVPKLNAMRM